MEIGGSYNLIPAGAPLNAKMPRGVADSLNRYAYAMADSTASYVSGVNATRVHRHLVDFKEPQQFIIVYDDVVTSTGQMKRTYLHYPNNYGASSDSTRGATTLSGTAVISSYPGTGNGDATQLLTQVLAPAGTNSVYVYRDNTDRDVLGGRRVNVSCKRVRFIHWSKLRPFKPGSRICCGPYASDGIRQLDASDHHARDSGRQPSRCPGRG